MRKNSLVQCLHSTLRTLIYLTSNHFGSWDNSLWNFCTWWSLWHKHNCTLFQHYCCAYLLFYFVIVIVVIIWASHPTRHLRQDKTRSLFEIFWRRGKRSNWTFVIVSLRLAATVTTNCKKFKLVGYAKKPFFDKFQ